MVAFWGPLAPGRGPPGAGKWAGGGGFGRAGLEKGGAGAGGRGSVRAVLVWFIASRQVRQGREVFLDRIHRINRIRGAGAPRRVSSFVTRRPPWPAPSRLPFAGGSRLSRPLPRSPFAGGTQFIASAACHSPWPMPQGREVFLDRIDGIYRIGAGAAGNWRWGGGGANARLSATMGHARGWG